MSDDLVERLRERSSDMKSRGHVTLSHLHDEAAEEITALRARLAEVEATLAAAEYLACAVQQLPDGPYHEVYAALAAYRVAVETAPLDATAVHANMLHGTIAKPTIENIIHLYGADNLRAALAQPDPRVAALVEAAQAVHDDLLRRGLDVNDTETETPYRQVSIGCSAWAGLCAALAAFDTTDTEGKPT
jgi:hypothetical protein